MTVATYEGRCLGCDETIREGQEIALCEGERVHRDNLRLAHHSCNNARGDMSLAAWFYGGAA